MTDLFEFDLISAGSSNKTRRTYSQRNVSSLQFELTKNRKMINMKTSKTTILNRTISFRPLTETSSSLANVENTPMKQSSTTIVTSSTEEIIEETPVKDEDNENETIVSEKMTRDIQRLAHRLRSSLPLYHLPIHETQANKPTTLHLSQVVNRVSRCNYVLRRFVRQAQQCSPKATTLSLPPHEKGRRRLFVDSPKQELNHSNAENQPPSSSLQPTTPRKASGVIKQLFASPSSSFKRTTSTSSNTTIISHEKRQKLF